MLPGNKQLIKDINRSIVLNLIKRYGPIARTEIAKKSRLGLSTISGISAFLLNINLIQEELQGESSGGRRPVLLSLKPEGGSAIGLKLTETEVIIVQTDLNTKVINKKKIRIQNANDPSDYMNEVKSAVDAMLAASGMQYQNVMGIGVGMSGFIDYKNGICRYSPIVNWHNVPLKNEIESYFDVPVLVDNHVNTVAQFEAVFGSGQKYKDFLVVSIGRGVGLGIVINGQVYRGSQGGAGELGHITVMEDGPICACGRRGCLEAFIGEPALIKQGLKAGLDKNLVKGSALTPLSLSQLAQNGDKTAIEIYSRAGHVFGVSLATLVNLFNPEKIIVSGEGVQRVAEEFFLSMRNALSDNVFSGFDVSTEILVDPLDDIAWARGAASLVLSEVFSPPI